MNPIVSAVIGGVVAILCGGMVLWGTVITARNTKSAASTAAQASTVATQIEGWDKFADRQGQEIDRLTRALTEERAVTASFAAANERLTEENRQLRTELDHHREQQLDPPTEGRTT